MQTLAILQNLPKEVLCLIGMGKYTLYKVISSDDNRASYALRVSATNLFVLDNDGNPIDFEDFSNLKIIGKVKIRNFNLPVIECSCR